MKSFKQINTKIMAEKTILESDEVAIREGTFLKFMVTESHIVPKKDGALIITLIAKPDFENQVQIGPGELSPGSWGVFKIDDPNAFTSGTFENMVLVIDSSNPPVISVKSRRNDLAMNTNAVKGRQGG